MLLRCANSSNLLVFTRLILFFYFKLP
uniref:Uncharacterized protein n=1 Tax=Rhizophora mucronata TaxID=61149 RepID=A0A2P2N529_RHIMU